ncbi:MAG: FprA family A-type flavoprotein, partial [Candidatus Njordarchaeales archaeon]
MPTYEISPNIFYVGVDDRKTQFFEGIWYIPDGISYNAYLIKDQKTALIEGGTRIDFARSFFNNISSVTDPSNIDYVIINHMEPDHTGTVPLLHKFAPNAKFVTTNLGKTMLANFYGITEADRIIVVKENDEINLGKMKLRFHMIPGVHWPETMVTYEETQKILFSGDAFGSYGALNGLLFDDEANLDFYLAETRRYFANIVGLFTRPVQNALKKLGNLEIKMIAPSHGLIWRNNPRKIIEIYDKLSRYENENKVLLLYGTMYGFTEELANYIARKLISNGVEVIVRNATFVHPSYVLGDGWDSKVIIFGLPTYDGGAFPPVYYNAYLFAKKQLKNKYFGIFGSSGWSGKG